MGEQRDRRRHNTNQIMVIVDTNYALGPVLSSRYYPHYSLHKSIKAGFGLPCLNHACDKSTAAMSDMFYM